MKQSVDNISCLAKYTRATNILKIMIPYYRPKTSALTNSSSDDREPLSQNCHQFDSLCLSLTSDTRSLEYFKDTSKQSEQVSDDVDALQFRSKGQGQG